MSVKRIGLSVLVAAICGLSGLRAQGPIHESDIFPRYTANTTDASPYNPLPPGQGDSSAIPSFVPAPAGTTPEGVALDEGSPPNPTPTLVPLGLPASPYLTYPRSPCCCGPAGANGPLGGEVFARSGIAFPIGGGIFNQYLHAGWDVEAGGRLLLFNPPQTAAWTGTLGISNVNLHTGSANQPVTLFRVPVHTAPPTPSPFPISETVVIPSLDVTVRSLNMTFVNMGFGREWWLWGSADPGAQAGWNWRVGIDGGGRWGSARVDFNEIQHHTGVVGGMYAAVDSDLERAFRCGVFFVGVRFEYNYIWTHLLQDQNNGDFQSLSLLFQTGVRF
jgi:hypothetical protein